MVVGYGTSCKPYQQKVAVAEKSLQPAQATHERLPHHLYCWSLQLSLRPPTWQTVWENNVLRRPSKVIEFDGGCGSLNDPQMLEAGKFKATQIDVGLERSGDGTSAQAELMKAMVLIEYFMSNRGEEMQLEYSQCWLGQQVRLHVSCTRVVPRCIARGSHRTGC